jgi:hypothetical protein
VAFSIYYVLLFFPTAVIVFHYHIVHTRGRESQGPPAADHESREPAVVGEDTADTPAAYAPG